MDSKDRLKQLLAWRKEYKSDAAFADAAGLSASFYGQIKRGERPVGEKLATKIESSIGKKFVVSNVSQIINSKGRVPIISWVQAGDWNEAIDIQHPNDTDYETVERISDGDYVYALYVRGDSMTAPPGVFPSFPEGYAIEVNPEMSADIDDFVIAKVSGYDQVTFKQLKIDGGRPYLKPLNPSHPSIFDEFKVIGTVTGATLKIKK